MLRVLRVENVIESYVQELQNMDKGMIPPTHKEHVRADEILCNVLRMHGENDLVDAYEVLSKWFD